MRVQSTKIVLRTGFRIDFGIAIGATQVSTDEPARSEAAARPPSRSGRIYSLGHSDHAIDHFLTLLRRVGISVVADVRSHPASQRLPQFNRGELEQSLRAAGIAYLFMGDQLGGRPDRPSLYDAEGRVDYVRVRATAEFRQGIERLCRGRDRHNIAMICAEEDPLDCHRGLMITPALLERGVEAGHIRGDGTVETTRQMQDRLLSATKVGGGMFGGLFDAQVSDAERLEMLEMAYQAQARRKAFRQRPDDGSVVQDSSVG